MKSGLMWYDSDPRKPSSVKIEEAAHRYREKFGVEPNACHVSLDAAVSHDRLQVVANRWIRPNYFWIGVDEKLPPARRAASQRSTTPANGQRAASRAPAVPRASAQRPADPQRREVVGKPA